MCVCVYTPYLLYPLISGHLSSFHNLAIFFLKILFIYSTEIETASERGNTAGGVGEEEAGSQGNSEPDVGLDPRTLRP